MKSKLIKIGSVVGILAAGFLVMNFLSNAEQKSNKRDIKPEIRTVEVEEIQFADKTLKVKGNGVIESQRSLVSVSEVSGKVIYAKNDLKTGTFAKEGEILLKIDYRQTENQLKSLRSDYINTVASFLPDLKIESKTVYDKWYKYFTTLDIQKTIPEMPEITDAQEKIMVSSRKIYSKFFDVKNQEIKLSKHFVSAPFTGYIRSQDIIENSFVSIGTPLFEIDDINNLEIAVPLLLDEYNEIDFRNNPEVIIYNGEEMTESISGKILRRDTKLEKNSQTLNVYVVFNNNKLNSSFLPGNYVPILIEGRRVHNVAVIPRHLVDGENNIFTMEGGKLGKRKVDIVAYQNEDVIVKNSLPESTLLVKTVLQKPLIGMAIQTLEDSQKIDENNTEENTTVALYN